MTLWTLIRRNLRFHARANLGVVLGAAIATAALAGALVVGDCFRATLRQQARERLGAIQFAMAPPGRYFRAALADDLQRRSSANNTGAIFSAVLQLPGTAATPSGSARANKVNVLGITPAFDRLARTNLYSALPPDAVLLSPALALQLGARSGDAVLLRVSRPSALPSESAIAPRSDATVALRLRVAGIAPAGALGNFSLVAQPGEPLNAFVSLRALQNALAPPTQRQPSSPVPPLPANLLLSTAPAADLSHFWRLADLGLKLRPLPGTHQIELLSDRVFIDQPIEKAASSLASAAPGKIQPILTYLANLVRAGTKATPYSLVTAADPPYVPAGMREDEIVVNQWLADDLHLNPGDTLDLVCFAPESGARWIENTNRFRVRQVVPMRLPWADPTLMPEFPGIEKAESTRDWDPGFPLTNPIRAKDEEYWKQHRGTPKAFLTLGAGQKLWGNRFGSVTGIRFQLPESAAAPYDTACASLEARLLAALKPAEVGMDFQPVRARAFAGADQAQDFGQLFLGFSFFVIAAALLVMALLFGFSLEARAAETGTLLALGLRPRQVRWILLGEGAGIALMGSILGAAGGIAYAAGLIWGLTHVWGDAIGGSPLQFHLNEATLAIGAAAGLLVALATMWLTLRKQGRQPARELLSGPGEIFSRRKLRWPQRLGVLLGLAGLAIVGGALSSGQADNPGAFFGAGALLLSAALLMVWSLFASAAFRRNTRLDLNRLALAGCTRRPGRSAATVALLSFGCFMVAATSAFRLEAGHEASQRGSGTGGFALVGESALPITADLNSKSGQERFGLNPGDLQQVRFVPFRVHAGDEASCLNLARAQKPRLLGVDPALLEGRFTFSAVRAGSRARGWKLLEAKDRARPGEIPAIGDANSLEWALGKKIGDTLDYTDDEGRPFRVRIVGALANSVLQGNLVVGEQEFLQRFPSESGYRTFLIDAPADNAVAVSALLARAFQDQGLELTPAVRRLNAFNAVQNTYLSTFQVLGGLGLLLGSAGLGMVVLRNVLERRAELALLLALGFPAGRVRNLVLREHVFLLGLGLCAGLVTAVFAVLPALLARAPGLPYATLGLTLGAVLVNALFWTWLATRLALRGRLLSALRNE